MSIKLENVSYIYEKNSAYSTEALKDVSLEINDGEFIGMIGHTGSGKSTLIQLFNALLRPSSGTILYDGKDIWANDFNRREFRFNVGLVFQYPEYQLFETTVLKDVCFGPKNKGLSEDECIVRAKEALKAVGMPEEFYSRSPLEMSGGQKRRAAIAGVLAMDPKVLILDEPCAGLDPRGKRDILDMLSVLRKDKGMTIILVSHSMEDVAGYADRLIVMSNGTKAYDGTVKEVFSKYKELEKIGLAAPQVTYVMNGLKSRGLDVDTSAVTIEEAKQSILNALRRR
ncbi:MAG: energy-coupling factor transporter ATPase [Lachnospiraceae bacterium]|nr:energy-coupling factor transporter ATPase [Lachnospiraceae bacterium]MDY6221472.1 energy-coupling factor transporter ATPase [Candidatus Alectryocaccobium sp.]